MKEFLRRFRLTFALYNYFHRKELQYNEAVYKKLGLKKKYFSSISSKDFAGMPGSVHDECRTDRKALERDPLFMELSAEDQESLIQYDKNGYAILRNFVPGSIVDTINQLIDDGLASGKLKIENRNKIMFAIHRLPELRAVGSHTKLMNLLSVLLNGKPVLFQSINFKTGSEQHTHSDSIHMTTYPLGGLLGVWIALEDIDDSNGPLHYYPGSHLLPYYLNKDYDNEGNWLMIGSKSYTEYENMIASKIKENHLQKMVFKAKKGDVLIWHANLFHGGNAHIDKERTRKSVVFHYFKEGSVCYHEITQRPAILNI